MTKSFAPDHHACYVNFLAVWEHPEEYVQPIQSFSNQLVNQSEVDEGITLLAHQQSVSSNSLDKSSGILQLHPNQRDSGLNHDMFTASNLSYLWILGLLESRYSLAVHLFLSVQLYL